MFYLQVNKGEAYFERSENNKLSEEIIFADRGIIYDRKGVELAWNKKLENPILIEEEKKEESIEDNSYSIRSYLYPGFSHILGYGTSPAKDKDGNYWLADFIGKDGLEKQYSDRLQGENGSKIVEILLVQEGMR